MSAPNQTVSVEQLAKICNITDTRVQQLAKLGVMKKKARGHYLLLVSIQNYIRYLQENGSEAVQGPESLVSEHKTEQIGKTKEERVRIQYENLETAQKTVLVEQAQQPIADCFSQIKTLARRWLRDIHADIPGLSAEVKENNEQSLIDLFNKFARIKIE